MKHILGSFRQQGKISITAIIGIVLVIAYALTWYSFVGEGHPKLVQRGETDKAPPIKVHLIAADLVKDTITMSFVPDVAASEITSGRKLSGDIELELDSGAAVLTHKFKKGETPNPWVAIIPITDGDLTDFPFDEYTGGFTLKASVNGGAKSIAKLDIDKSVHGYKFSATAESVLNNTELEIEFRLSRSPAVMFLVIIGMLSLTLVVLSAVNVAWHVGARGRKVEFSMMVWVAALLFVIPAVRNGMPGSPPPGAVIDFGLFFWLHMLAVIALLTLVSMWSKESK